MPVLVFSRRWKDDAAKGQITIERVTGEKTSKNRAGKPPLSSQEVAAGLDSEDVRQHGGCCTPNALHHPDLCVPNLVFACTSCQLKNNLTHLV